MPVHLRPSAPTAPDAIVCGDPARALGLAQELLVEPRMSNHHRGLWGYHGQTANGLSLTIQATGLGGPSAAVVITELAELGVERLVRVGTCTATDAGLALGTPLIVSPVLGLDGTTTALTGGTTVLEGDAGLLKRLRDLGLDAEPGVSTDLYYPEAAVPLDKERAVNGQQSRIRDLQSAAALAAAKSLGLAAAATVIVSRSPQGRLEDDPLEAAAMRLGRLVADALAGGRAGPAAPAGQGSSGGP